MKKENNYFEIFYATPMPYLILDHQFTIVDANAAYLEATLTTRKEIVGRNIFVVFPDNPNDLNANGVNNLNKSLHTVLQTKKPHRMDIQKYDIPIPGTNGKEFELRYWSPLNTPVLDEAGDVKYIIHQVENVTAQVLSAREKDLREQFVAALSHDLRTPLTAAKICANIVERKAKDPDAVLKAINKVVEHINRADNMITDLLNANRINAGMKLELELETFSLKNFIENYLNELSLIHGDRFQFIADENEDHYHGHWNEDGIKRIIDNLCSNAIKYGSKEHKITITLARLNNLIQLSVHNHGPAISLTDQQFLFDPYIRKGSSKAAHEKGWGLGLTLVKGFTEAHNGTVTVESDPTSGTIFTVQLPILNLTETRAEHEISDQLQQ